MRVLKFILPSWRRDISLDDRVSQKEDNVRAFESDVRDCKLFFYSQLENTRYRIPPRQIFLFCAELCTWRNLFHNLEKLEREREIQFGLHSTNASKIREDERRRTRCIAKKKGKEKKLETKTRWTKMNLKRMVRGWKNNAKKKKIR